MTAGSKVKLKLVRILFNDGSTFSGQFSTIAVGGDLLILSAPGKLKWFRRFAVPTAFEAHPGIRNLWVGRI
jgi:hypothetical protein